MEKYKKLLGYSVFIFNFVENSIITMKKYALLIDLVLLHGEAGHSAVFMAEPHWGDSGGWHGLSVSTTGGMSIFLYF